MRILLAAAMLLVSSTLLGAEGHTVLYVLRYIPGGNWQAGTPYEAQPGIQPHFDYLERLFEDRRLVMSGGLDGEAGGLVLLQTDSLQEAKHIAANDPAVGDGIVNARVSAWRVNMSSMRIVSRRPPPGPGDTDEPYRLKRIDPNAPINIDDSD